MLYAQTDKAVVQAIDAETGKTLWSKQVGQPQYPTMSPGVNRDFVAIINGSRLYVLNRFNGDLLWETELAGAPGAGPALSTKRIYVPIESRGRCGLSLDSAGRHRPDICDRQTERNQRGN